MKNNKKISTNLNYHLFRAVIFTILFLGFQLSKVEAQGVKISNATVKAAGDISIVVKDGSLINSGVYTKDAETLKFTGTTPATIGGTASTTVANLTLNNSAGLTLENEVLVDGLLDFQEGILTTGNHLITFGATGSTSNAAANSYIEGKMAHTFVAPGAKHFPIGKDGNYRPLTLQFSALTGTSVVEAEQFETGLDGDLPENTTLMTTDRHWRLIQSGGSGIEYFITLDPTDYTPNRPVLILKQDEGTIASSAATTPDYTNDTPFNTFSEFGLGEVCKNPDDGGLIAGDQYSCNSFTPEEITNEVLPSGHIGELDYQWQMSITGSDADFYNILEANDDSFSPGSVIQTTWFRRLVRVTCDQIAWDQAASSNVVEVTVYDQMLAGTASGTQTICYDQAPAQLSSTAATGGSETYAYQWQSKVGAGSWENISGETELTYQPGTLTQTITYRLAQTDEYCADQTVYTNEVTVTIYDQLTLSCPNDFDVNTDPGVCIASVTFSATAGGSPTPDVTYKVDNDIITSPHNFTKGTTTVVVTAENICGLLTCSFTVTVTDNEYPTIVNLPGNINQTNDEGDCGAVVTWIEPTSADNCEGHSIQQIEGGANASYFTVGTHTITYQVADASGNKVSESFTITITDDEAPKITCLPDVTISCEDSSLPADVGTATATDNCDANPTITYSDEITPGPCTNTYTITRTWKATDLYENFSTCAQTINVQDITKPTVVTKNITIELDASGNASITDDAVDNGSYDNCPGTLTFSTDITTFTCEDLGDNEVILTVTDACGNAASATATVKVVDIIKPEAKCKPFELFLDASGNAYIQPADVDDGSNDNCGIITMTVTPNHFTCDNVGGNQVVLTVTDGSGNTSSCTTTVKVTDNIKPTVLCKNIIINLDNTGTAVITPDDINNGSSDNCDIATMTLDRTDFSCDDMGGDYTVTLTVTDVNGNVNSAQATVTVNELSVPTTRVNIRAAKAENGQVRFKAYPINGGDNPTYVWFKNGEIEDGVTGNELITTCKSGDIHWVVMQSSLPCTAPAKSNEMCTY